MATAYADRLSRYLAFRYPESCITDFAFLASGFESEIYAFRLQRSGHLPEDYILRLFPGEGAAEKLIREARGLHLLKRAGYPVPALFLQETDPKILGKPFEIIEKLEGQALWPILASAKNEAEKRLLARSGLLLAQLHKLDWQQFTDNANVYQDHPTLLLDEIIAQYRSLYTSYNLAGFVRIVEWLNVHKQEISIQPAVVHQDFHANNIILCSNDQLFVIDWTQFGVSDYRIDVCWTLLIMGDFGNAQWSEIILNAYMADRSDPIEHLDYFNVIVSMKLLASIVISFTSNAKELGLRPEKQTLPSEQRSTFERLSQRLQQITGLTIPELDNLLGRIG